MYSASKWLTHDIAIFFPLYINSISGDMDPAWDRSEA